MHLHVNQYSPRNILSAGAALWVAFFHRAHNMRVSALLCLLVPALALTACVEVPEDKAVDVRTWWMEETDRETIRGVVANLAPAAQGLESWNDLAPAVRRSLEYLRTRTADAVALTATINGEQRTVLWSEIRAAQEALLELLPELDARPELLMERFRWLSVSPEIYYTGYYEPLIQASREQGGEYQYPLYKLPPDVRTVGLGDFHPRYGSDVLVYRLENDKVLPYYDRQAIDQGGALSGQGLELAWAADYFDVFVLQIQGSGRLRYADGTEQYALYAGKNGRQYRSLGALLREAGELPEGGAHMPALRAWVAANPDRAAQFLYKNQSYVFFSLADDGPVGAMNRKLTPWVSLAVDRTVLPLGGLAIFTVPVPEAVREAVPGAPERITGIGLPQDTGGAIKGRRIDLFCGNGDYAELLAGHMDKVGNAWLLLKR